MYQLQQSNINLYCVSVLQNNHKISIIVFHLGRHIHGYVQILFRHNHPHILTLKISKFSHKNMNKIWVSIIRLYFNLPAHLIIFSINQKLKQKYLLELTKLFPTLIAAIPCPFPKTALVDIAPLLGNT